MVKHFAYGGKIFSYNRRAFMGGLIKPPELPSDVVQESNSHTMHRNGVVHQKPLQQLYGQDIRGVSVRMNNNVIRPFSNPKTPKRIPLSADSINTQTDPVVSHLGKSNGQSKSQVQNVALFKGKGLLQGKNNIRLVL